MTTSYATKRALASWRRIQREAERARRPQLMMFIPHPLHSDRGEWVPWADVVAQQRAIAEKYHDHRNDR